MQSIWLAHSLIEIPRGFDQVNCDNRSQRHVEAIYGSFDFIGPTRTA